MARLEQSEGGGWKEGAKKWGWRLALVGGLIFIVGVIAS